jgi:selenide,water dikinase
VDFFTPVVDDPYRFGQIAAANALSDVYAMGGVPKTAMNLVGFPSETMDLSILRTILEGGIDKIREAGAVLVGGHSVDDAELKYGLSVTGFVHPQRVLTNGGIADGDCLVLTKPLGTGIVNTAIKGKLADDVVTEEVTLLMATLNRYAAEAMEGLPVNACTDITGFGLVGHLAEMMLGSGSSVHLDPAAIPVIPEALDFAAMGLIPAGAYRNREFRQAMVAAAPEFDRSLEDILYDPQTSGGLLISVAANAAATLLQRLADNGCKTAAVIGTVTADGNERIHIGSTP